MFDYTNLAGSLGMTTWLFVIILIWSAVWKLLALWKSARKGDMIWFIVLGVVNLVGILEILYIFVFSKWTHSKGNVERMNMPAKKSSRKKRR